MSIVDSVKDIAKLAHNASNMELYDKLVSLQADLMALVEQNYKLSEEVHELRGKVNLRESLEFESNFYWQGNGESKDGPFCVKCFDKDHAARRMLDFGNGFACPTCKTMLTKKGGPVEQAVRRRVGSSFS